MRTVKIWNEDPSAKQIEEICNIYSEGGLVIMPTDTLYAVTCSALDMKAIEKLCRLKNINPQKTNLSVICADISMASEYAKFDNQYFRLLKENVPGAFTFLFKAASSLPRAFKDRKVVGVRIPANNICLQLASALGNPLLTTSIDFKDEDYEINPDLIAEAYEGRVDLMIDGGEGGTIPSTIIDCTGNEPEIIREGKGILK